MFMVSAVAVMFELILDQNYVVDLIKSISRQPCALKIALACLSDSLVLKGNLEN